MKNKLLMTAFVWLVVAPAPAYSQSQPIEVLVLTGPGVAPGVALAVLDQLNDTMDNSDLGDHVFVNAGASSGVPGLTVPSPCIGGSADAQIACLVLNHADERDTYAADIVLQVRLDYIISNTCGAASPGIIDAEYIWLVNHNEAYAAAFISCPIGPLAASHEVMHLLSIEHKTGTDTNDPVENNHAWTYNTASMAQRVGTVTAQPRDCGFTSPCTAYTNKLSNPNYNFSSSIPVPAGDTDHANARQVVRDLSWDVVAAYRPLPSRPDEPDQAYLWFAHCVGTLNTFTATWDSSNLGPGEYFEVQYLNGGIWTQWYEGAASCNPITSFFPEITVRVRVKDVWGQVSQWLILLAQGNCGGDPF